MADINDLLLKVGIAGVDEFVRQLELVTADAKKAKNDLDKTLGKSFVDLKELSKSFTDGLSQSIPGVGTAIKLLSGDMSGLADVAKTIGGSISGWIESADEAATVEAQLAARIKSTGAAAGLTQEELIGMAEALAEVTLYEDDAIKSSEALLLTFTNVGKDTFPRAEKAITNLATAMGTDLQSATMQLGKALNDPVGSMGALSRAGVQFTEQQKALIQSFVDTNQIAKAQDVILTELEKQVGGAAEAAATAGSGPWKQFKKALGELGETVGSYLIPVLNGIATVLRPIAPILLPLAAAFGVATVAVVAYNSALGTTIITAVKTVATAIPGLIASMGSFATATLAAIGPIGWLAAGVTALALVIPGATTSLSDMIKQADGYKAAMDKMHDSTSRLLDITRELGWGIQDMAEQATQSFKAFSNLTSLDGLQAKLAEVNKQLGAATNPQIKAELVGQALALEQQIKEADALAIAHTNISAALEEQKRVQAELGRVQFAAQVGFTIDPKDDAATADYLEYLDNLSSGFESVADPAAITAASINTLNEQMGIGATDVIPEWEQSIKNAGLGAQFANGELEKTYLALEAAEQKFKELGGAVKEHLAQAFGDLAFNMGQAIAMGEDLGQVMKKFLADMVAQLGKMVGMALINMALTAPFPLSLGFLAAGLLVLGLSGLLSGALSKGKDKGKGAAGGFTAPTGAGAQAPTAATGLSSFENADFGAPIIQTIIQVDGTNLAKAVNKANSQIEQRRNG